MKRSGPILLFALLAALAVFGTLASAAPIKGPLKFCSDPTFPPMEYKTTAGKAVGFDIDLTNAIAKSWKVKARFVETGFPGLLPGLAAKRCTIVISGITEGDEIKFSVLAFPGVPFAGKVARLAHALEVKTRTMPVELDVDNAAGKLAPGMFAEVQWRMTRPDASLFVPASSIVTTTERTFVIRLKEGVAEWINVRLGVATPPDVEVFGALAAGDWVATRGTDELRPGTKVIPKEPAPK